MKYFAIARYTHLRSYTHSLGKQLFVVCHSFAMPLAGNCLNHPRMAFTNFGCLDIKLTSLSKGITLIEAILVCPVKKQFYGTNIKTLKTRMNAF